MLKKTVYIAEKPDIGRAVAAYLWPDGGMEKGKGCFRKGDIAVTWAFGHIPGMATPELYGEEYKVWSNYPILPSTWLMKPDPQKKGAAGYNQGSDQRGRCCCSCGGSRQGRAASD